MTTCAHRDLSAQLALMDSPQRQREMHEKPPRDFITVESVRVYRYGSRLLGKCIFVRCSRVDHKTVLVCELLCWNPTKEAWKTLAARNQTIFKTTKPVVSLLICRVLPAILPRSKKWRDTIACFRAFNLWTDRLRLENMVTLRRDGHLCIWPPWWTLLIVVEPAS